MTDWLAKLGCYLASPPWAAWAPDAGRVRSDGESLASLLGVTVPPHAEAAERVAFGPDGLLLHLLPWPDPASRAWHHRMARVTSALPAVDVGRVRRRTEELLASLKELVRADPRAAFCAVWRLVPSTLAAELPGLPVQAVPADPRLPGHGYLAHRSLTTAVAGCWESGRIRPALLLFTLASAQDHVSASRRTQDFWMGSFLVSYLVWRATQVLCEELGPDTVIAPSLWRSPLAERWLDRLGVLAPPFREAAGEPAEPSGPALRHGGFANVVSAVVPLSRARELAERVHAAAAGAFSQVAQAVRGAVEEALRSADESAVASATEGLEEPLRTQVRAALRSPDRDPVWRSAWERQIEDAVAPYLYSVVVPWPVEPDEFDPALEEAARLVGEDWVAPVQRMLKAGAASHASGALYPVVSRIAGRLLAARKATRTFSQSEEPGEKSSLSGAHGALSLGASTVGAVRALWGLLPRLELRADGRRYPLLTRVRRGDRLSAPDLTRRLAAEAYFAGWWASRAQLPAFPSTSGVAVASFRHRCLEAALGLRPSRGVRPEEVRDRIARFVRALRRFLSPQDGPDLWLDCAPPRTTWALVQESGDDVLRAFALADGDWFYPESFLLQSVARTYQLPETEVERRREACHEARRALEDLLRLAGEAGLGQPGRYYAILASDGDRVGNWLSSGTPDGRPVELRESVPGLPDPLSALPRLLSPADTSTLTAAVSEFAHRCVARVVTEDHLGYLAYAGGDDVLALVTVEDALSVASSLEAVYRTPPDRSSLWLPGPRATLKFGVAVVHHAHPLAEAIRGEALEALKADARGGLGGDGCAVRVVRRSGGALVTGLRWRHGDGEPVRAFADLVRCFAGEGPAAVSPRLAADLAAEADSLARVPEAAPPEVLRLARRHVRGEGVDHVCRSLTYLLTVFAEQGWPGGSPVAALATALRVAQFLGSPA